MVFREIMIFEGDFMKNMMSEISRMCIKEFKFN